LMVAECTASIRTSPATWRGWVLAYNRVKTRRWRGRPAHRALGRGRARGGRQAFPLWWPPGLQEVPRKAHAVTAHGPESVFEERLLPPPEWSSTTPAAWMEAGPPP
jgi:hypothetical protein